MTTRDERAKAVEQVNANFRIEGFEPDAHDKALQAEYIAGEATVADMLRDAHRFAEDARQK